MNRHLDDDVDVNRDKRPPPPLPPSAHQDDDKEAVHYATTANAGRKKLKRKRERPPEVATGVADSDRGAITTATTRSSSRSSSSPKTSTSNNNKKKFCPTVCPTISKEQDKIMTLKRRATTYWLQGHHDRVRTTLEEALSLLRQRQTIDKNSREELFWTLSQLADSCQETQDLHAAIHYRNEALAMQLEYPERWNPLAIKNLEIIATMYLQLQMHEKGLRCYENIYSIQIQDTNIDSESPEVAATLAKLALLNYSLGKHSVALRFYQEELRLRLCHAVNENFLTEETAICLDSTGIAHMEMRQFSLAKLAFIDSFRIRQALASGNAATAAAADRQQQQQRLHFSMGNTLVGLATTYLELEDRDVALICFEHALQIKRNLPEVVNDLQQFGRALLETGDFENASRYFRKALLVLCPQRSEHKEVVDKLYVINGNLSMMLGDIEGMMALFTEYCRHSEPEEDRLDDGLMIFGFTFYSINRVHPPCAPLA